MRKEILQAIQDIEPTDKEATKELSELLKKENLDYAVYPLHQSLLKYGSDPKENDFLYIIDKLPDTAIRLNSTKLYNLIYNLIEQGKISGDENWLYLKSLYSEPEEETIYKIKIFTFIKDKYNLRKYGDPKAISEKDFIGTRNNVYTADHMKKIIQNWQSKSGGGDDEDISGRQIILDATKSKTLDKDVIINYILDIKEPQKAADWITTNKAIIKSILENMSPSEIEKLFSKDIKHLYSSNLSDSDLRSQLNLDLYATLYRKLPRK